MTQSRWTETIEAIRRATFDAPKAGSHTEWAARISDILDERLCVMPGTGAESQEGT